MEPPKVKLGAILIVDDDPAAREILSVLLGSLGYEVTAAADGLEALAKVRAEHYDLVITDLNMPNVNGIDLLESIKGASLDTAVLLVSAEGSIPRAVEAMKLGAVNFIEKPLSMERIKSEVRRIFRERKQQPAMFGGAATQRFDSTPSGSQRNTPTPPPSATPAPTPSSRPSPPGELKAIGRYEIVRRLGFGGMATVYECFDPHLRRVVAVKVLRADQASRLGDREEYLARFRREAHLAGTLSHPNIAAIYDFGEVPEEGMIFLAMELVRGKDLKAILGEVERLPPDRAIKVVYQVADGLEFAHRSGIVHRDVKPANVMITQEGVAKLLDFGIAYVQGSDLTGENNFLGSMSYVCPEVIRGARPDYRADQFSLGVILHETLTGKRLFASPDFAEMSRSILYKEPPSLSSVGIEVPQVLQKTLDKLLAKLPEDRYTDETRLLMDLAQAGRTYHLNLQPAVPRLT